MLERERQANVLVPLEPGVVAAIIRPLADRLGMKPAVDAGVIGQVHAAPGTVGIAGDEVAVVLVVPGGAVFVLSLDQVVVLVVVVGGELVHQLAVPDFPQRADTAGIKVELGAGMGDDGLILLADDVADCQSDRSQQPLRAAFWQRLDQWKEFVALVHVTVRSLAR